MKLLEKLKAIREALLAFQALAEAGDVKKLAELARQKVPVTDFDNSPVRLNYEELWSYMTPYQKDRVPSLFAIGFSADRYLKEGESNPIDPVTRFVPPLLADLDDIAEKLQAKIT